MTLTKVTKYALATSSRVPDWQPVLLQYRNCFAYCQLLNLQVRFPSLHIYHPKGCIFILMSLSSLALRSLDVEIRGEIVERAARRIATTTSLHLTPPFPFFSVLSFLPRPFIHGIIYYTVHTDALPIFYLRRSHTSQGMTTHILTHGYA